MLTIGVSGKKGKEKTFQNYFDKMTKKTKIGLIQLKISKNVELNIKNAISKIKVASNKGAKIICVPELFLSKYFCQTEKHSNFKLAEKIPNKTTDIFCKMNAYVLFDARRAQISCDCRDEARLLLPIQDGFAGRRQGRAGHPELRQGALVLLVLPAQQHG